MAFVEKVAAHHAIIVGIPEITLFFEQDKLFGFTSNVWVSPAVAPVDVTVDETYALSEGLCRGDPSMRTEHICDSEKSHGFP